LEDWSPVSGSTAGTEQKYGKMQSSREMGKEQPKVLSSRESQGGKWGDPFGGAGESGKPDFYHFSSVVRR